MRGKEEGLRKSLPGAPRARTKKPKLDLPADRTAMGQKVSKTQTKIWAERHKKGWHRRTEQRS